MLNNNGLVRLQGKSFASMLYYGINCLKWHEKEINELNVFPVPDGDTGTNMVLTLSNAFPSIDPEENDLEDVVEAYAKAAVFGARGNSGVIISQFFHGLSKRLTRGSADPRDFAEALFEGYLTAYRSVEKPVEGTILTVMKEAGTSVDRHARRFSTIDDCLKIYLTAAKKALENTPNLLPVLKKAGVVDSGGQGFVYLISGMLRYLSGEELYEIADREKAAPPTPTEDFSSFTRESKFPYGYCTEVLLQLTISEEETDLHEITSGLSGLGESIVTFAEGDKVKVHIHTGTPEVVLAYLHRYGEFLTMKIENMSVGHTTRTEKYLKKAADEDTPFAIVVAAPNTRVQHMFSDMGADVVILAPEAPSSNEFIEAFRLAEKRDIIVFPNSKNSILSAMQAVTLYNDASVTVINCRSVAECYSALAFIDYGAEVREIVKDVNKTIHNICEVAVTRATKSTVFGNTAIKEGDYFAMRGGDVISTSDTLLKIAKEAITDTLILKASDILTIFVSGAVSEELCDKLSELVADEYPLLEASIVGVGDTIYDLVLSFE